jgi:integrase
MSYIESSRDLPRNAFAPADAPMLSDVIARLDHAGHLTRRQRADLRSAVRTVGRILDRPLSELPAHPEFLRKRLEAVVPAAVGLTAARWTNVRSLLRKALDATGFAVMPGRYLAPLTPAWATLHDRLPTRTLSIGLSRFLHFCSASGIEPGTVSPETFQTFREALEHESLLSDPRTVHREACRCWNMAAEHVAEWPRCMVDVPIYKMRYILDWADFPASFRSDVEAMLDAARRTDPLVETTLPRINAITAKDRLQQLRRLASAAVLNGIVPERLRGIADLVQVDVAKAALRFYLERSNNKLTSRIHDSSWLIWMLARHWVGVDEGHLHELRQLIRRLDPGRRGMTDKNRSTLRQFNDADRIKALLALPDRCYAHLPPGQTPGLRQAVELQVALAVALLTAAPVRIRNLASIHLQRNIVRTGKKTHLYFPGEEVKNGLEMEFPLPLHVSDLLDRYVHDVRPAAVRAPNDWLFPGEQTGHKKPSLLSSQIADLVEGHIGVRMTAHQFRHLAGYIFLREHPGGHEVVRRLLGHRSITTTLEFYAGMEVTEAVRHYDQTILTLREAPGRVAHSPRSKRRARV